jgi:DNA-binding CsgD family transcriptional regulator
MYAELRNSVLHASRGRKRKLRSSDPSRGVNTPLTMPPKNPQIPLPIPPQLSIAIRTARRLGIRHYTISCLAIMGASFALKGSLIRATRLWGAEGALRSDMGIPRMPAEAYFYGPYLDVVRDQLGEVAWEKTWQEGRAMGMEEAIEYGLSEEEPAHSIAPGTRSIGIQTVVLTRREEEVAALLARQDLTTRQIASELSISEHTVAAHIAKIMKKLGFHSRAQITAWVTERRLPSADTD